MIWQDVECGAYEGDLRLWRELARERAGAILELGAGSGRVALDLARRGDRVLAVEREGELAATLEARAKAEGLPVEVIRADARSFAPRQEIGLVLAPMQFIQILDPAQRRLLLERIAGYLPGDAVAAFAVVEHSALEPPLRAEPTPTAEPPLPDVREIEGWVYSSRPLWVDVADDAVTVRRLRQRVSPSGELTEAIHDDRMIRIDAEPFEAEALEAGLRPAGRRPIPTTPGEAGSTAILLEAAE